jgi:phosphohistidine phosphatase SixA
MNRLFLVRHGHADVDYEDRNFYSSALGRFTRLVEAEDRGLTDTGRLNVLNDTVSKLQMLAVGSEAKIVHTNLPRTRETASLIGVALGIFDSTESEILTRFSLDQDDLLDQNPAIVLKHILSLEEIEPSQFGDLVVVTHQPFIRSLIGVNYDAIPEGSVHRVSDAIVSQIN